MNKELINKLLKSKVWEDNLLAFQLMKGVKYNELENLLDLAGFSRKTEEYYVYERFANHGERITNVLLNDEVAIYTGSAAILFIPVASYYRSSIKPTKYI